MENNIGYVYVMSNPAWDGYYKVGMSKNNLNTRIKSYQTSSPLRDFKLEYAVYTDNHAAIEEDIHFMFRMQRNGEWIKEDLSTIIDAIENLDICERLHKDIDIEDIETFNNIKERIKVLMRDESFIITPRRLRRSLHKYKRDIFDKYESKFIKIAIR